MASSVQEGVTRPHSLAAAASVGGGIAVGAAGVVTTLFGLSVLHYDQFLRYGEVFVFKTDDTFWGWVFVAAGMLLAAAGLAATTGTRWGRSAAGFAGMCVALLMAVWVVWYPGWVLPVILLIMVGLAVIAIANRALSRPSQS